MPLDTARGRQDASAVAKAMADKERSKPEVERHSLQGIKL